MGDWAAACARVQNQARETNAPTALVTTSDPADVLPWAAASHCAFGLWMHTYFRAQGGDLSALELSADSSNAVLAYVARRSAEGAAGRAEGCGQWACLARAQSSLHAAAAGS